MKITSIKIEDIEHRPLMKGLSLKFPETSGHFINANCLIGINGSGKSQLLETIAEIFLYVDQIYRKTNRIIVNAAPLLFEIEYVIKIEGKKFHVTIVQHIKKGKAPIITVLNENKKEVKLVEKDIYKYLPQKVIGYTSGENETLSIPFHSYYDNYAEYVANKALKNTEEKDYEPTFYFMDYNTNLGIAISNLIFEDVAGLSDLKNELQIDRLKSFQIILQTNQTAAPDVKSATGETGVVLTKELKEWRDFLIKCATCFEYDTHFDRYTLDFLNTKATRDALKFFFQTPFKLYTALYKFEILNNLIIDKTTRRNIYKQRGERKLNSKMPTVPEKDKVMRYSELKLILTSEQEVDYLSLSDGEHQFFNIFGSLLMMNQENAIFLLDEPETHFNPLWRRKFISKLKKLTANRSQDLFITSHSPFIVSDCNKDSVYIFHRITKDQIKIDYPQLETFGASFNHILKMAFDMDDSVAQDGSEFIDKLLRSNNIKDVENGIEKLGESPQLLALYRRLEVLKQK